MSQTSPDTLHASADAVSYIMRYGFDTFSNVFGNYSGIIELKNHPYFIACQFHPELKSKPLSVHPLFVGLIKAGIKRKGGL